MYLYLCLCVANGYLFNNNISIEEKIYLFVISALNISTILTHLESRATITLRCIRWMSNVERMTMDRCICIQGLENTVLPLVAQRGDVKKEHSLILPRGKGGTIHHTD